MNFLVRLPIDFSRIPQPSDKVWPFGYQKVIFYEKSSCFFRRTTPNTQHCFSCASTLQILASSNLNSSCRRQSKGKNGAFLRFFCALLRLCEWNNFQSSGWRCFLTSVSQQHSPHRLHPDRLWISPNEGSLRKRSSVTFHNNTNSWKCFAKCVSQSRVFVSYFRWRHTATLSKRERCTFYVLVANCSGEFLFLLCDV